MIDDLKSCVAAMAQPGQPTPLFTAMEKAMSKLIGFKLFTMMVIEPKEGRSRRIYTTNALAYPVGGFKTMGPTPWGKHVIEGKQPYIGRNADDIR